MNSDVCEETDSCSDQLSFPGGRASCTPQAMILKNWPSTSSSIKPSHPDDPLRKKKKSDLFFVCLKIPHNSCMHGSRTRPRFPESQKSFIYLFQFSFKAKSRVKVKGKNTQQEFNANFLQFEISAITFCYHCTYTSFLPEAKRLIIKTLTRCTV